jgi:hypothetical protein
MQMPSSVFFFCHPCSIDNAWRYLCSYETRLLVLVNMVAEAKSRAYEDSGLGTQILFRIAGFGDDLQR